MRYSSPASSARRGRRETRALARARAEQRFGDVRQLANAFLFDFHDSIADLEGSTPARKLIVSKGLEYLDRLANDAGDRVDLRREVAAAYLKVGDVQGRPFTPNLGDTAGALASYRKAVSLYESIGGDTARDEAMRRELALAYMRLSDVLTAAGDTAASLSFAQKSLAIEREVSSDATDTPAARRALVASYTRVGDMLAATGNVTGALEHRRTALAIMESVIAAAPDDVANIRQLGVAYQKLGNTLGNPNAPNIGDHAGALAALERVLGDLPHSVGALSQQCDASSEPRRRREQLGRRPLRDEARRRGTGAGTAQPRRLRSAGEGRSNQRRRAERSRDRLLQDRAAAGGDRKASRRRFPSNSAPRTFIAASSPPIPTAAT